MVKEVLDHCKDKVKKSVPLTFRKNGEQKNADIPRKCEKPGCHTMETTGRNVNECPLQ